MCFGKRPPPDNTAAILAQQEAARQAKIEQGKSSIDAAFQQFGDPYFQQYQEQYGGFYNPQLEDQYTDARGTMTADLARRGMLESTAGAAKLADLFGTYNDQRTSIASRGANAANDLRRQVDQSKSSLYSLNEASADPDRINNEALASAKTLMAPPQFDPMTNVFAAALQPVGNFVQARQEAPGARYQSPYKTPTGMGSGTVRK
jgi:curved DNA-binding protein CbpA